MKKKIESARLSLKKKKIASLTGQDHIAGGAPVTVAGSCNSCNCPSVMVACTQTLAPDLCQPSFLLTGCQATQNNCPSFPPQCSVAVICNG